MNLINRNIIRQFAPHLDLLNTLGGGVVQPQLHVDKTEQGVVIRVSAPSVDPESFHVMLNDARLTVYAEYRHSEESRLAAPLFVNTFDLPSHLDLTRVDATQEENELHVLIPFKDAAGYFREINIKRS